MPDYTVKADVDTMLRANDKAGIRSAIGVGTTDAPTFLAQTLTGQSLTGTQATSLVDLSATWNTTGTPSALKLNVTDTASNAASNLMDLQKGGISTFKVAKNGNITLNNAARATISDNGSGLTIGDVSDSNAISIYANVGFGRSLRLDFGMALAWNTIGFGSGADLGLWRDAAGILAQRNGSATQAFRVYNDYGAGVNFSRFALGFSGAVLNIGVEQGGTGTNLGVAIKSLVGVAIHVGTLATNVWNFTNAGQLLAATDNTYDIGASGANRPRNVYMGSWIRMAVTTVAGLPAAATAAAGARMFVNDALTPVFGSAVTGGGAVTVPVYSTGSAWNVG